MLPRGCHSIPFFKCPAGKNIQVNLTSTSHWYQHHGNRSATITSGIVFFEINKFAIPFSIAGAEVVRGPGSLLLSYKHTNISSHSTAVDFTKADKCLSLDFSKNDIFDFMKAGSFLNSLFRGVLHVIPGLD